MRTEPRAVGRGTRGVASVPSSLMPSPSDGPARSLPLSVVSGALEGLVSRVIGGDAAAGSQGGVTDVEGHSGVAVASATLVVDLTADDDAEQLSPILGAHPQEAGSVPAMPNSWRGVARGDVAVEEAAGDPPSGTVGAPNMGLGSLHPTTHSNASAATALPALHTGQETSTVISTASAEPATGKRSREQDSDDDESHDQVWLCVCVCGMRIDLIVAGNESHGRAGVLRTAPPPPTPLPVNPMLFLIAAIGCVGLSASFVMRNSTTAAITR